MQYAGGDQPRGKRSVRAEFRLGDYQFRQISNVAFELKQMKGIMEEKQLSDVQFYVKFVDEILPNPRTGKKSLIVKGSEKEREMV